MLIFEGRFWASDPAKVKFMYIGATEFYTAVGEIPVAAALGLGFFLFSLPQTFLRLEGNLPCLEVLMII